MTLLLEAKVYCLRMAHIYPDGPIPTENPAISSLVDPPFIALYSYVATVGTVFFAWSVYRFVK